MMNTINPTVAEIDAAVNVLAILEMAKDAGKLKATLQEVKDAQDAAASERAAADKAAADLRGLQAEIERENALIAQERAKLKQETAQILKNNEQTELMRAAMRDERERFDRWMAAEREVLDAAKAKVDSDAVANARRAEDLQAIEAAAATRVADAEAAIKAADAKRAEFDAKLANLKAMVG